MATNIIVEVEIDCPPSEAPDRIYRAFGTDRRGTAALELTAPLDKLGLPPVGNLSRTAFVRLGESQTRKADNATLIPIQWQDLETDAFPVFRGTIEIVGLDKHSIQLAILGDYDPPFGPVGAAFNAAVGKTIAQATVDQLIERLRKALETSPSPKSSQKPATAKYLPTYE